MISLGSDNGLLHVRHQAIIWTNVRLLFIGPSGTNISEIWIAIEQFAYYKIHLNLLSTKWQPFCLGFNDFNGVSQRSWRRVYWFHLVRPSVRPPVRPSVDRIMSALYLLQYSPDPFHIHTSYQATSEGVSCVIFFSKLKDLKFWQILWIQYELVDSMGNHGAVGGILRTQV